MTDRHRDRASSTTAAVVGIGALIGIAVVVWSFVGVEDTRYHPVVRPQGPLTIAFVGDSITVGASDQLHAVLDPVHTVEIEAQGGQMAREMLGRARDLAALDPDVAVVNLGSNDNVCLLANELAGTCHYPDFTVAQAEADLSAVIDAFDPSTCILGVTLVFGDAQDEWLQGYLEADRIDGIVDWASKAHSPGLLSDGLGHLTPKGAEVYADTVAQAIDEFCPS